jgi:hypothetical protein
MCGSAPSGAVRRGANNSRLRKLTERLCARMSAVEVSFATA